MVQEKGADTNSTWARRLWNCGLVKKVVITMTMIIKLYHPIIWDGSQKESQGEPERARKSQRERQR